MTVDTATLLETYIGQVATLVADEDLASAAQTALATRMACLIFVARDGRQLLEAPWCAAVPPGFLDAYAALGGLDLDPIVATALHNRLPVPWTSAWLHPELSAKQRGYRALFQSSGLVEGLAVPIGNPAQGCDVLNIRFLDSHCADKANQLIIACIGHITWWRYYQVRNPEGPSLTNLSPREMEVLKWLKAGKSARDIATILGLTPRAVEFHAGNILGKLDSADKVTAVITAIRRGIIPL